MKKYILTASILLSVVAGSAIADVPTDNNRIMDILNAKNVSYAIINRPAGVSLITYGYKDANDTCLWLSKAGFVVEKVENYNTHTEDEKVQTTVSRC